MVKDLDLLLNIRPLFNKKIVVWGIGKNGKTIIDLLLKAGISEKKFLLCDLDDTKWGSKYRKMDIYSPQNIVSIINSDDYMIIVSPINSEVQDSILISIHDLQIDDVDCYTEWSVKWAVYFYLIFEKRTNKTIENKDEDWIRTQKSHETLSLKQDCNMMRWFMLAPIYDERILVYQPGKVGSTSVYHSLVKHNKYVLHTHTLSSLEVKTEELKKLCKKMGGIKIITIVRDPIMQMISGMWENFDQTWRYSSSVNFDEIQNYFFGIDFDLYQYEWFNIELKTVFGVDIFKHPFNKEKGYLLIEEDGMSILLMTMEKMNDLNDVIGKFVGIDDFCLDKKNIGSKKAYRFAYSEYKSRIRFSDKLLNDVYYKHPFVKHFYTDDMIKNFISKWNEKNTMGESNSYTFNIKEKNEKRDTEK